MELYISDEFLNDMESEREKAYSERNDKFISNLAVIEILLCSRLPVKTDMTSEQLEMAFRASLGEKKYSTYREALAISLVKNNTYTPDSLKFKKFPNYKAFYFLNNDINPKESGVIKFNSPIEIEQFYLNCNRSNPISKDYSIIKESVPPTNSMIYIDNYLFSSAEGIKIRNLIKFINLYKSPELRVPFQLSIVTSYENNKKEIPPSVILKAVEELKNMENLEFQIYLDKNVPHDDRLFFGNYVMGNIGHPLDDRPTVFNQNFMGNSVDVNRDYLDYKMELQKWKKFTNSIRTNTGRIQTKYSNKEFQNRIFDDV
jgi:hypothetical protein